MGSLSSVGATTPGRRYRADALCGRFRDLRLLLSLSSGSLGYQVDGKIPVLLAVSGSNGSLRLLL